MERPASPLRLRDFRLLWTGQTISSVGDQVFPVAIAVTVLDRGGGPSGLGLVLAARFASLVALLLLGGVWADRLPRRRVMITADAVRAVSVLGLALAPSSVPLAGLAAFTFVVGGAEAFFQPAYGALVPSVLPEDRLAAANALTSLSVRLAAVVGPGLGGLLVGALGARPAFVVDAASFLASMLTLLRVAEPPPAGGVRESMLPAVRTAVAAVRARPWAVAVLVLATAQLMLVWAPVQVFTPVVARERLGGNAAFGLALACFSAGGVLGALLAGRLRPRRPGLVGMIGLLPYALVPLSLWHTGATLPWVIAAEVLGGLGLEPFIVYWVAALQREFPRELLGRVVSLDWLCSFALLPAGLALAGPAAAALGRGPVLIGAAVVEVVPTLVLLLVVPGMTTFSSRRPSLRGRPGEVAE